MLLMPKRTTNKMKETYTLGKKKQVVNAKKFIEYVKKYNHSDRGKLMRAMYILEHKDEIVEYNKKYLKNRRKKALLEGICTTCFKTPSKEHYKTCPKCLQDMKKRRETKKWQIQ
jgi:hypothetical protein